MSPTPAPKVDVAPDTDDDAPHVDGDKVNDDDDDANDDDLETSEDDKLTSKKVHLTDAPTPKPTKKMKSTKSPTPAPLIEDEPPAWMTTPKPTVQALYVCVLVFFILSNILC